MKKNILLLIFFVLIFKSSFAFSETKEDLSKDDFNSNVQIIHTADSLSKEGEYKKANDLYKSVLTNCSEDLKDDIIKRVSVVSLYEAQDEKNPLVAEKLLRETLNLYGTNFSLELRNSYNYYILKYADLSLLQNAKKYIEKKDYENAELIFKTLEEKKSVVFTIDEKTEYAKILLYLGKNKESFEKAILCKNQESYYIAGLAAFNMEDFINAEKYLFLSDKINPSAKYYLGIAKYKNGKYKDSYNTLYDFASNGETLGLAKKKIYASYITASEAALQCGMNGEAIKAASDAERTAANLLEAQKASELCAGILQNNKMFQNAIDVLTPYAKGVTPQSLKARYLIADIYVKAKKTDSAIETYSAIIKDYGKIMDAENAFFHLFPPP